MNTRATALIGLTVIALVGCKGGSQKSAATAQTGPVVATVNGYNITAKELSQEIKNLPPQFQMVAETPEGKMQVLDQLVARHLALEEAKKSGIDKSPEVAERFEDLKDQVIVQAYLKKRLDELKPSDDQLKKVYDQYKDQFKHPEQIRASHILVKSEKEAQEVDKQLQAGAKFDELARKYSIDGSAAKGGDLGWFAKGTMVPEFESAAFALKEGSVSGIVKTKHGFHIIQLTGKRGPGVSSFEEEKDKIKAFVLPKMQQEFLKKLKDDLKKNAKLTINSDALKGVQTQSSDLPSPPSAPAKQEH